jgi:hypothetical protein
VAEVVEHLPSKCEALSSNPMVCLNSGTANNNNKRKQACLARHWWLTSVILATQEAGIRSIEV